MNSRIVPLLKFILLFVLNDFYKPCFCSEQLELADGQTCVDNRTNTIGCCRRITECESAIQERTKNERPTTCSFEKDVIIVCCKEKCSERIFTESQLILDEKVSNPLTTSETSTGATIKVTQRISTKKCNEFIEERVGEFLIAKAKDRYFRRFYRNRRSIFVGGGRDTYVYEFPHMAALGWTLINGSLTFKCGGSLISERFVLTAAHCTSAPPDTSLLQEEPIIVRLGEQNILDGVADGASPIDVPIKRIIKHPNYKPPKKYFDIALIELDTNVELTLNVTPACLWIKEDFDQYTNAIVIGWGTTSSGGENSPILQKATLNLIANDKCNPLLNQIQNRLWSGLEKHQLCAGVLEGGIDACQAALGWTLINGSLTFKCGGSLISERFVLTAAHCTSAPPDTSLLQEEPIIVRLGEQNILDGVADGASPIDVPIKRIIKHPNYKPPKKYFDIALIELDTNVELTLNVTPACLWIKEDFDQYTNAIVIGWGTTSSGGENSPILQKATLNLIANDKCNPLLNQIQNRLWSGLEKHQLCAGVLEGGIDACQGDSGGPIQVRIPHNVIKQYYSIIGVTSFGKECALTNLPGVYTRVSSFIDWVEDIVWGENAKS